VKFELRRKLPLESAPDAGFVSLAVWTDARNGVMLASEVEKIVPLVTDLLDGFRRDYARHNPASDSNSGTDLNSIPATRS
jgi:hypothetical protein